MALYGVIDEDTGKLVKDDNGKTILSDSKEESDEKIAIIKTKEIFKEIYPGIINELKTYLDIKEDYYHVIACWILGTYIHKSFNTYPYLFFNAMRGSGKTRALNLITALSKDGEVMGSPTEAVLFRTQNTLAIDEFEDVANKDKSSIRELLNSGYKKGSVVKRMKRKKTIDGEEQVVETFDTYRPIVMANINGMDEVLGDRCITLVLEKSDNPIIARLMEDFTSENIKSLVKMAKSCMLCMNVCKKNIHTTWNKYISNRYIHTLHTYNTLNTLNTLSTQEQFKEFEMERLFNKIHDSNIIGRNLELFFPLFIISNMLGQKELDRMIEIAIKLTKEKQEDQRADSIDVSVYDFISKKNGSEFDYYSIKSLTNEFKSFIDYEFDIKDNWLNPKWFGAALKRLNLIVDKRRKTSGMEISLNVTKAINKLKMFRNPEEEDNKDFTTQ